LNIVFPKENKIRCLLLKLAFEGNVKKLKIMQIEKKSPEIKQGEFICKIPEVIISLIGYYQKIRKEIVHAILQTVELETSKTTDIT
jgi:hypothetical protein